MKTEQIKEEIEAIFARFGLSAKLRGGLAVSSPLTGEDVAFVVSESDDGIGTLIERSCDAQARWKQTGMDARGEFLGFLAGRITTHSADLARLVHFDSGKSVKESAAEVASTVGLIHSTVKAASYEPLPSGASRSKEFSPLGVIAIISPFNFPMAIGMWTGVPALLAGNAVVNKPSENASLAPVLYETIFTRAAREFNAQKGEELVPDGVFQVAVGAGEIGKALVADPRVAKVVFTGSIAGCETVKAADRDVPGRAGALTEGGAANFAVFSDQHEGMAREEYIRFIVGATMKAYLPYAGQKCINTRQVLVHEGILDEVVAEFKRQLEAFRNTWQIESAFSEENPYEFTPLINSRAGERFEWAVQQARQQGGEVIGGERLGGERYCGAQYFLPAIAVFAKPVPLSRKSSGLF